MYFPIHISFTYRDSHVDSQSNFVTFEFSAFKTINLTLFNNYVKYVHLYIEGTVTTFLPYKSSFKISPILYMLCVHIVTPPHTRGNLACYTQFCTLLLTAEYTQFLTADQSLEILLTQLTGVENSVVQMGHKSLTTFQWTDICFQVEPSGIDSVPISIHI